jgi:hypothetical protein
MKKVMPILAFVFISMLLIGSFPTITSACSCAEVPSAEAEFERSQAVLSGKVIEVREKRSLKGSRTKSVLFEVNNTWKGVEESQIIITTGQDSGDCGFDFKEGQEYLVYANESTMYGAQSLVSTICDRTNELSVLQEDLKKLGEGQPPIEEVDLSGKHNRNQLYMWIAVVTAIGILFLFIIRRRLNGGGNR